MLLLQNHLDSLDQWIKLLLSWSFLCDDCLKTMTNIYIYSQSISQLQNSLKILFFHVLRIETVKRTKSTLLPEPDNVRSSKSRGI
jgi:hypothetical protein